MMYTIDGKGKVLGRLASEIAQLLLGKNSTSFAKNVVADVTVNVTNASGIIVTGNKMKSVTHKRYSGFPGGLKEENLDAVKAKKGMEEVLRHAVRGMLPKNKLQDLRMKSLHVSE